MKMYDFFKIKKNFYRYRMKKLKMKYIKKFESVILSSDKQGYFINKCPRGTLHHTIE